MKTTDKLKVVLASGSPRRRDLLREIVDDFSVMVPEVNETLPKGMPLKEGVRVLSERKGAAVASQVGEEYMVISSDTLVELEGEALGKPRDKDDAVKMLSRMSGKVHFVHTGVAVHYQGSVVSDVATASVRFRKLDTDEIRRYVDGGEPMDKAGSYGIQGDGGKFVSEYCGDFDTIMGLSVYLTCQLMERIKRLGDE